MATCNGIILHYRDLKSALAVTVAVRMKNQSTPGIINELRAEIRIIFVLILEGPFSYFMSEGTFPFLFWEVIANP